MGIRVHQHSAPLRLGLLQTGRRRHRSLSLSLNLGLTLRCCTSSIRCGSGWTRCVSSVLLLKGVRRKCAIVIRGIACGTIGSLSDRLDHTLDRFLVQLGHCVIDPL